MFQYTKSFPKSEYIDYNYFVVNKSTFTDQLKKQKYQQLEDEKKMRFDKNEELRIAEDKKNHNIKKQKYIDILKNASPEELLDMIAEQHVCAEDEASQRDGYHIMNTGRYQYHKDSRDWLTQIYLHKQRQTG